MNAPTDRPLDELLMQRATGQLSAAEADALVQQVSALPPYELAAWERAAGELTAVLAAESAALEAMPATLAERVTRDGLFAVRRANTTTVPQRAVAGPTAVSPLRPWGAVAGWMAAAAALVLWVVAPRERVVTQQVERPVPATSAVRAMLVADTAAVRMLPWKATGDSAARGATGDVVWSADKQTGVMRFVGLASNDVRRWQYQLWIFDRKRDQRYPVDGGVFDVPPGATEVLVPITPRVRVGEAVMFAVTVEKPGGVVVSGRERIALVAESAE
ncbi:MAG: anti-sigma factor [Gemmatimonadaceae bacterium]|jgi:hypothetical protein|nr:anti-sigma factor [Gemmatimonadaceae bacterium]